MPFLDDIKTVLEDAGVATFGMDLFLSNKASVPKTAGATVHVKLTGGTTHERIHNVTTGPGVIRPGAQIRVRADDEVAAYSKAIAAYNALVAVHNVFINSGFYREIRPLQEPFDMGVDDRGQINYAFNVLASASIRRVVT